MTEKIERKQRYLDKLSKFLEMTMSIRLELGIDENEYVEAYTDYGTFEYSVWGDNQYGIFLDTLRALKRQGIIKEDI